MTIPKLTPTEIEAIRYRWVRGETADSLAECFEVAPRTIRTHCKGLRAPRRIDPARVQQLRAEGHTLADISALLDCDRSTIVRIMSREQARAAA